MLSRNHVYPTGLSSLSHRCTWAIGPWRSCGLSHLFPTNDPLMRELWHWPLSPLSPPLPFQLVGSITAPVRLLPLAPPTTQRLPLHTDSVSAMTIREIIFLAAVNKEAFFWTRMWFNSCHKARGRVTWGPEEQQGDESQQAWLPNAQGRGQLPTFQQGQGHAPTSLMAEGGLHQGNRQNLSLHSYYLLWFFIFMIKISHWENALPHWDLCYFSPCISFLLLPSSALLSVFPFMHPHLLQKQSTATCDKEQLIVQGG